MKKQIFSFSILALSALAPRAGDVAQTVLTEPVVTGMYADNDGTSTSLTFVVESPDAGSYFPAFWLCPAQHADGTLTTYRVSVNGEAVGSIRPTRENWQSAGLADNGPLRLERGTNTVTLNVRGNETPMVEKMTLSRDYDKAEIPSDNYDAYLAKAERGASCADMADDGSRLPPVKYPWVPLRYSFWTTVDCKAGDEIEISTQSAVDHEIDVFFYGRRVSWKPWLKAAGIGTGGSVTAKYKIQYNEPSTDEMQTLNWQKSSRPVRLGTGFSGVQSISRSAALTVIAPVDGTYCISPRPREERTLSTVSITIGDRTYSNQPVYYSPWGFTSPGNHSAAVYGAVGTDQDDVDPMVFVEGADGGRVVGYNDDAPSDANRYKDLTFEGWSAYVEQSYYMPVSGIHISNYWSNVPETMCVVVQDKDLDTVLKSPVKMAQDASLEDGPTVLPEIAVSPNPVAIDGTIAIDSPAGVTAVEAYNADGRFLGRAVGPDLRTVSLRSLGITAAGMHLLRILTADGNSVTVRIIVG